MYKLHVVITFHQSTTFKVMRTQACGSSSFMCSIWSCILVFGLNRAYVSEYHHFIYVRVGEGVCILSICINALTACTMIVLNIRRTIFAHRRERPITVSRNKNCSTSAGWSHCHCPSCGARILSALVADRLVDCRLRVGPLGFVWNKNSIYFLVPTEFQQMFTTWGVQPAAKRSHAARERF